MRKGYLPLLSLSYLEYSEAFDDDVYQELIFLSYAKEFASLGLSLNEFVKYASEEHRLSYTVERVFDYQVINLILLVMFGFVLGLSATLLGLGL
jgi:hypothetical protein